MAVATLAILAASFPPTTYAAAATRQEQREADLAFRILRQHRLVPKDQRRCFFIMRSETSKGHLVVFDVRERHRPPRCPGDPGTAPRLFSLEIDMRTGRARWDRFTVNDLSGVMRPVPRKASR
jgi:hypothetical protein